MSLPYYLYSAWQEQCVALFALFYSLTGSTCDLPPSSELTALGFCDLLCGEWALHPRSRLFPLPCIHSITCQTVKCNRQNAQISGSATMKICVVCLLTKLLSGGIMVISARLDRERAYGHYTTCCYICLLACCTKITHTLCATLCVCVCVCCLFIVLCDVA